MRDICKVIGFLLDEVIPEAEPVRIHLKNVCVKASYRPPESQSSDWRELAWILQSDLGDPSSAEWKQRVSKVMSGEEKIPAGFKPKESV